MLTSDHIDMLLTVIDKGSFSAAARALGRTPSAISMAIANLEAEADLVLFDRGTREPTPTAAMAALLPDARSIAERLHALRAHAQHLSEGVEDTLRLGLAAELDGAPVARALTAVAAKYPALAISIVTAPQDVIIDALHRGAVDLCVAYGGPTCIRRSRSTRCGPRRSSRSPRRAIRRSPNARNPKRSSGCRASGRS